ncbi:MAG: DUF2721 domain-containing protein [Armatimonadetes bacterium]|nr:DUF2721 domain-containing protein [Armatimonadota bacterium]
MNWKDISTAAVVPVVIVSACALLCLALFNRLAAVVARLRSFERERLAALGALAALRDGGEPDEAEEVRHTAMIRNVEEQFAQVSRRATLLRRALMLLLTAILALMTCCLLSGLATLWLPMMLGAMVTFLAGVGLMMAGVVCAMLEMRCALVPVLREAGALDELADRLSLTIQGDSGD